MYESVEDQDWLAQRSYAVRWKQAAILRYTFSALCERTRKTILSNLSELIWLSSHWERRTARSVNPKVPENKKYRWSSHSRPPRDFYHPDSLRMRWQDASSPRIQTADAHSSFHESYRKHQRLFFWPEPVCSTGSASPSAFDLNLNLKPTDRVTEWVRCLLVCARQPRVLSSLYLYGPIAFSVYTLSANK